MKLKLLVNESWYNEEKTLTNEQKKEFVKKVAEYNTIGKAVYNKHNLVEIAKQLAEIAAHAEIMSLSQVDESFDRITVERNMKELKNLSTNFAKVATEAQGLNSRLTGLYEDMGMILNRYYNINDAEPIVDEETL